MSEENRPAPAYTMHMYAHHDADGNKLVQGTGHYVSVHERQYLIDDVPTVGISVASVIPDSPFPSTGGLYRGDFSILLPEDISEIRNFFAGKHRNQGEVPRALAYIRSQLGCRGEETSGAYDEFVYFFENYDATLEEWESRNSQ